MTLLWLGKNIEESDCFSFLFFLNAIVLLSIIYKKFDDFQHRNYIENENSPNVPRSNSMLGNED
jgi:hypothetical protein